MAGHPKLRWTWAVRFAAVAAACVVASAYAVGCGSRGDNGGTCIGEGCACDSEGVVSECATTLSQGDDSITCATGSRTCNGGKWGACTGGGQVVIQSNPSLRAKATTPGPCLDNPCDPDCKTFDDNPGDIDAGGSVTTADGGGITLSEGGVGGSTGGKTCTGLECSIDACAASGGYMATQLSGRVYDPAGKNPIYNVLVYVPNGPLDPLTDGVSCAACSTGSGAPIVSTLTDYTGSFTLKGVPSGTNIPLVVQSGKWRRKITLPSVTKCVNNDTSLLNGGDGLKLVRFPKNRSEGDIPRIAFVSGSADPFQCLFSKMGMDVSTTTPEVGVPYISGSLSPRRIHYYQGTNSAGQNLASTLGGGAPSASGLYDTVAHLKQYDAVILSCEGDDYNKGTTVNQNLVDYVSAGGRVFATHFSYRYLQSAPTASQWPQVVKTWSHTGATADPMTVLINQTFTKGDNFAKWLNYVGASPTLGQLAIAEGRRDYDYVDTTRATPWMYSNSGGAIPSFSGASAGTACVSGGECASGTCTGYSASTAVTNGGFESNMTGWSSSGSASSSTSSPRSGSRALQLGSGDASASQTFTAPAGSPTLGFWFTMKCGDGLPDDWFTVTLKNNTTGITTTVLPKICSSVGWTYVTAPLVGGNGYTLTFSTRDGDPAWIFSSSTTVRVDDVSVYTAGSCTPIGACTKDSDCPSGAGAACWNGTCIPGHDMEPLMTFNVPVNVTPDKQCGRVVYSDFHVSASALGSGTTFPGACKAGDLSAQEKALEFMLFDLTSCLTPDYAPPAVPPFKATTVSRDYSATCPPGSRPVWHFFDWKTVTPGDSSIAFSVQTGDTTAALNAMTPLPLATVSGAPVTTWTGKDVSSVLSTATPPVANGLLLRVNMTLTPSSGGALAPTLVDWRQAYTCAATE